MFFSIIFFLNIILLCECTYLIDNKDFDFCNPTNISIDLDMNCNDVYCVIYKNVLAALAHSHDEFNYIYTKEKKIVIYSAYGRLYYTNCTKVTDIEIMDNNNCKKDVPVKASLGSKLFDLFLTSEGILRESSQSVICPTNDNVMYFDNENKEFEIRIKQNKVFVAKRNETIEAINFENSSSFENIFHKYFDQQVSLKFIQALMTLVSFIFISIFVGLKERKFMINVLGSIFFCKRKKTKAIYEQPSLDKKIIAQLSPITFSNNKQPRNNEKNDNNYNGNSNCYNYLNSNAPYQGPFLLHAPMYPQSLIQSTLMNAQQNTVNKETCDRFLDNQQLTMTYSTINEYPETTQLKSKSSSAMEFPCDDCGKSFHTNRGLTTHKSHCKKTSRSKLSSTKKIIK
jgi:hypothetical protein